MYLVSPEPGHKHLSGKNAKAGICMRSLLFCCVSVARDTVTLSHLDCLSHEPRHDSWLQSQWDHNLQCLWHEWSWKASGEAAVTKKCYCHSIAASPPQMLLSSRSSLCSGWEILCHRLLINCMQNGLLNYCHCKSLTSGKHSDSQMIKIFYIFNKVCHCAFDKGDL